MSTWYIHCLPLYFHYLGARSNTNTTWIGVVVTDGESTEDPEQTKPEAQNARVQGVYMFAIGIGTGVSNTELMDIGNLPSSEYVFSVDNFDSLTAIQETVQSKACNPGKHTFTLKNESYPIRVKKVLSLSNTDTIYMYIIIISY